MVEPSSRPCNSGGLESRPRGQIGPEAQSVAQFELRTEYGTRYLLGPNDVQTRQSAPSRGCFIALGRKIYLAMA